MRTAILFLILIFLIDLVFGIGFRFYRLFYFDTSLHFFGGFFVAMLFYHYLKGYFEKNDLIKNLLIIVGATVFIGVVWEFAEYTMTMLWANYLFEKYGVLCCIGNLDDTITDLLLDTLGALTYALSVLKYRKNKL